MWLKRFKAALVQDDTAQIEALIDAIPSFETLEERREAATLCKEALRRLEALKQETLEARSHLKKHIEFLRSTRTEGPAGLDLKS